MAGCSRRSSRIVKSPAGGESWRGRSIRWCNFAMWRRISMWRYRWMGKCRSMGSRRGSEFRAPVSQCESCCTINKSRDPSTSKMLALSAQVFFAQDDKNEGLLGEEVVEGFYGVEFVIFDIEDGVELGDIEDVLNLLGEVQ